MSTISFLHSRFNLKKFIWQFFGGSSGDSNRIFRSFSSIFSSLIFSSCLLSNRFLPSATWCGKVMFSVMSVCSQVIWNPPVPTLTPSPTHIRHVHSISLCNLYICRQAASWSSIERSSCLSASICPFVFLYLFRSLLRPFHTERKRKRKRNLSLLFVMFSLTVLAFARCKMDPNSLSRVCFSV